MRSSELTIRKALKSDSQYVYELICELAIFENAEKEVDITQEELLEDGFGVEPKFHSLVALYQDKIVGMALYYPRYSTWKGSTLYLEDLIVTEDKRGKGIGHQLMTELIELTKKEGYRRLEWQVLDWNESALDFYKDFDVEVDNTWLNCRIAF